MQLYSISKKIRYTTVFFAVLFLSIVIIGGIFFAHSIIGANIQVVADTLIYGTSPCPTGWTEYARDKSVRGSFWFCEKFTTIDTQVVPNQNVIDELRIVSGPGDTCPSGYVSFGYKGESNLQWCKRFISLSSPGTYTVVDLIKVLNGAGKCNALGDDWIGFGYDGESNFDFCEHHTSFTISTPVPPVPTGLTASCPSPGTTASLFWTAVSGATYYNWRADDTVNGWTGNWDCTGLLPFDQCVNNLPNPNTTFNSIAGDTYNWWVHACNAAGCSAAATGAPFTCASPPAPSLTCSPSTQTVNVNQAATVTAFGGTGYYSWFTDSTGTVSPGVSSANVTYTAAGTHVLTVTSGAQSTSCNVVANNPAPTASISASPTSITSGNSSTLSWTCTNSTSASIDQGIGSVNASSGSKSVSPTNTTTYTLTCTGSGGTATASATVTVNPPVGAPTLTATLAACSSTNVNLSWTSVSGADYYYVRRCPGSASGFDSSTSSNMYSATCAAWSGNASGTSVTDATTQNNTTYTYGVVAHFPSTSYSSTWSNLQTVTPYCAVGGAGPFTLSLGGPVSCKSVPLSWTSSANAFEYNIKRSGVVVTPYQPYTALNFTDTSVRENASYVYQILAYASDVAFSNTLSVNTPFCQLPGNFTLSSGTTACNSASLSWTASSGATGYRILKGSARVDITPYQPYTALNFTDTLVSQNTAYQYQIEAYNNNGTNRSNEISVTTPYCPPTLNFSASPTSISQGQSTTLTWSTTYANSCTASNAWSGSKAVNGSEVNYPSPPPSATYTLACTGPGGTVSQSATINISTFLPTWKEIIPR